MKKSIKITLAVILLVIVAAAAVTYVLYDQGRVPFLSREGWDQNEKAKICYRDYWGEPITGWQELSGNTYFFDGNGSMATGWQEMEDGTHYFTQEGIHCSGWLTLEESVFYLNEQGVLQTGWQNLNGKDFYFAEDGAMATGWFELDGQRYLFTSKGVKKTGWVVWEGERYYLGDDGAVRTGWQQVDGHTYYLGKHGAMQTGWLDLDGNRYLLKASGVPATGWIEREGNRYFFNEEGVMLTGWQLMDGQYLYFEENGAQVVGKALSDAVDEEFPFDENCEMLIGKDNPVPNKWTVYPVEVENGWMVDARCYSLFVQMLADCREAGNETGINSAYRSTQEQQQIWDNRVAKYMEEGDSKENAIARVSREVAKPGYSEHQLGLAVDIDGFAAHEWMAENSWRYGFIVRYPEDKQELTGTTYEPWHVRFVGTELAEILHTNNWCLEEYYNQQ